MLDELAADFRRKLGESVRLQPEGVDRYRVLTPFQFDDGDHLVIVLRRTGASWTLSDEGHTFMQLTYELDEGDLRTGTRQKLIDNAISAFGLRDREGELVLDVPPDQYGEALYSFVQAILKISDVTYLTRERARSTFIDDLGSLVAQVVPQRRREADWFDRKRDPEGNYRVQWRINQRAKPVFVYGLTSDDAVRDANIALLQFEKWGLQFHAMAVFEDQQEIGRNVLARFTDVCDRQFASLGARDRIAQYLREELDQG